MRTCATTYQPNKHSICHLSLDLIHCPILWSCIHLKNWPQSLLASQAVAFPTLALLPPSPHRVPRCRSPDHTHPECVITKNHQWFHESDSHADTQCQNCFKDCLWHQQWCLLPWLHSCPLRVIHCRTLSHPS